LELKIGWRIERRKASESFEANVGIGKFPIPGCVKIVPGGTITADKALPGLSSGLAAVSLMRIFNGYRIIIVICFELDYNRELFSGR